MSIRRILTLSFTAILALFGLDVLIYAWGNARQQESFERLGRAIERQRLLVEVEQGLGERRRDFELALVMSEAAPFLPEQLAELRAKLGELNEKLKSLLYFASGESEIYDEVEPVVERCRRLTGRWGAFYLELASLAGADSEASAEVRRLSPDDPLAERALGELQALRNREFLRVGNFASASIEQSQESSRQTTRLFALSAVLGFGVALALSGYLTRRLARLESGARRIGRGELEHRLEADGEDELASLAQAFNAMADNLRLAHAKLEASRRDAERASEAKSAYLASMSHELRTPLNAIIGYSEMLTEEAEELGPHGAALLPDLERVLGASRHLVRLINQVLDLAKIEAGKMSLDIETFAVAPLLSEVAATVRPLVEANGNDFTVEIAPELGEMRSDPIKLRQTLYNLLSNAAKFTREGRIVLRGERLDGAGLVRLSVQDTGIGMTPEQRREAFKEFTQAELSTSRRFGGTGLGLAISRQFCRLMGGDINLESKAGQGTVLTVELPIEVPDGEAFTGATNMERE